MSRAGLVSQCVGQPVGVRVLGTGLRLVAVGYLLGQVADAPGRVLRSGQDALGVELGAEPGDVQRLIIPADGVERVGLGGQELAGRRVEVPARCLVPDGQVRVIVDDVIGRWPPDLVVGGGDDLAQLGAGDRAADGDVDVRGEAFLRFDRGEVLEVLADEAAQVLDEPVEQRGEVQRVAGGPLVVVGVRIGRGTVCGESVWPRVRVFDGLRPCSPRRFCSLRRSSGYEDALGRFGAQQCVD